MSLPSRQLGASGPALPVLTLGTMRLLEAGLDVAAAADLIVGAVDAGVTALHSSTEYESFDLYSDALSLARRRRPAWEPVHVVKLAEPGFGQDRFDGGRFDLQVDHYRTRLGADRIDVVQWMVRHSLDDHPGRVAILRRDWPRIGDAVAAATAAQRVGAVVAFPYDAAEHPHLLAAPWCDGLALYLNPTEVPPPELLDGCLAAGKGVVGIRPLAAGAAVGAKAGWWSTPGATAVEAAVRFALLHPAVATTVVSTSRASHLHNLVAAAGHAPSAEAYAELAEPVERSRA